MTKKIVNGVGKEEEQKEMDQSVAKGEEEIKEAKEIIKGVGKGEEQKEMDQNVTKGEEEIKEAKEVIKGEAKEEEQREMDRNITEREEEIKGDMSGVGKGDGVENVKRYVWLSFLGVDYG